MTDTQIVRELHVPPITADLFRFQIRALATLRLPAYKGSTLRGGFGSVFRRTVCTRPEHKVCAPCHLRQTCVYPAVFEASPPPGSEVLSRVSDIPQPFVLRPPADRRTVIDAGEILEFGVVLIGKARAFLPHFIVTFEALGRAGLGHPGSRYVLEAVDAMDPWSGDTEPAYSSGAIRLTQVGTITPQRIRLRANALNSDTVSVTFVTPTRITSAEQVVEQAPTFQTLIRAQLRRLSSLAYFHCGERWEIDYALLTRQAESVQTQSADVQWVDWGRWSSRQQQRMTLGGLTGAVTYAGDLRPFTGLLAAGELVHVGKATAFGHGEFRTAVC